MPATIHPFPSSLSKLTRIRHLAERVADTVAALDLEPDLTVPALCSVVFEIATNAPDPELGRQAAESLRIVAGLIDKYRP